MTARDIEECFFQIAGGPPAPTVGNELLQGIPSKLKPPEVFGRLDHAVLPVQHDGGGFKGLCFTVGYHVLQNFNLSWGELTGVQRHAPAGKPFVIRRLSHKLPEIDRLL